MGCWVITFPFERAVEVGATFREVSGRPEVVDCPQDELVREFLEPLRDERGRWRLRVVLLPRILDRLDSSLMLRELPRPARARSSTLVFFFLLF